MTEPTSSEDRPATEGDRIAQSLKEATRPEAIARAGVRALLLIADQLGDISIEIAAIPASM